MAGATNGKGSKDAGAGSGPTTGVATGGIMSAETALNMTDGPTTGTTGEGAVEDSGVPLETHVADYKSATFGRSSNEPVLSSRRRARVPSRLRVVEGASPPAGGVSPKSNGVVNRTWLSVESAARIVDMHPTSFRRQLEKNVFRSPDGGTESRFDGIIARKLGGRWKVLLGPRWLNPLSTEGENSNRVRATSSSARPEHTGRSGK